MFLVFDRFDADWFVQMGKGRHPRIDIWEVAIDDLDEEIAAAPSDVLWREIHGYSYYTQPIPATKLKLVASDL